MDLLQPFVVTAAHSGKDNLGDLEPAVREVFTTSGLSRDPNRFNVFMFVLDPRGQVVHEFHGLPGRGTGRSDHLAEIQKARAKLKLAGAKPERPQAASKGLPDLHALSPGVPAGVRLFVRQDDPKNSVFSKLPVVEVVSMKADDWRPVAYAPKGKEIDAEALKSWPVWLYPAGIRAADEQKRFQKFSGRLQLDPAGSDDRYRYALLRGKVLLAKGATRNRRLRAGRGRLDVQARRGGGSRGARGRRGNLPVPDAGDQQRTSPGGDRVEARIAVQR